MHINRLNLLKYPFMNSSIVLARCLLSDMAEYKIVNIPES